MDIGDKRVKFVSEKQFTLGSPTCFLILSRCSQWKQKFSEKVTDIQLTGKTVSPKVRMRILSPSLAMRQSLGSPLSIDGTPLGI